jgi:O-antigen/teichoic acid export membrane protein
MSRVSDEAHERSADEATRGSAIKLGAEVSSRLLTVGTTIVLARGLGVESYGAFGRLWVLAPLVAELGELGLQATATRALVAGTRSLRALTRARLALLVLLLGLGMAAVVLSPLLPAAVREWLPVGVLVLLVLHFALAAWGEFFGVALRCRGARVQEALVLLALRGGALAAVAAALAAGAGFASLGLALVLSQVPGIALGLVLLRRHPSAVPGPDAAALRVLREAAPLAAYGGLLLLAPRVEFLVLSALRGDRETGLFLSALNLVWPLSLVPSAVAAGAMPALTREAMGAGDAVRRRTAATIALFAAPAAVGLALVAPALVPLVFGAEYAPAALWVRILAVALVPLFMNGLLAWALIAAGRASLPPRLLGARIAVAFAFALALVPRYGATGAAAGFVLAEVALLVLGARACAGIGFAVPVAAPVAFALVASVPMALAVSGLAASVPLAVAVGVVTYAATLAASWWLFPAQARRLVAVTQPGPAGAGAGGARS